MKLQFNLSYFLLSVFIFIVEVSIATIFKDWYFVRAFLGDILVVIIIGKTKCEEKLRYGKQFLVGENHKI